MAHSPQAPSPPDPPRCPDASRLVARAASSTISVAPPSVASVTPKRVSRRSPFQPTLKRRRAGVSLRTLLDAALCSSPGAEAKPKPEAAVKPSGVRSSFEIVPHDEVDGAWPALGDVVNTEPAASGLLRTQKRSAASSGPIAVAQSSAERDAAARGRHQQAHTLNIQPFQPHFSSSFKHRKVIDPLPSAIVKLQAALHASDQPFEPPITNPAQQLIHVSSQPIHTTCNAAQPLQVSTPDLKLDVPANDRTHSDPITKKRTRTPSPSVPRKRPRSLLHNPSDPVPTSLLPPNNSRTPQAQLFAAHSKASFPRQLPPKPFPSANVFISKNLPPPPTRKRDQKRSSPPPLASVTLQSSQSNATQLASPTIPRMRSPPSPRIPSAQSLLPPNFTPRATLRLPSPSHSPHCRQPWSPPRTPRRRSPALRIGPIDHSPIRRRSQSLSPLRNNSSHVQALLPQRIVPRPSHARPLHRFHSPTSVRHSRRSRSPPLHRLSRSPLPRRRRSPSPSLHRSSCTALPLRRYSRSPTQRGRILHSPIPRFCRSRSPPHHSCRSRSPPHHSCRSRSPPYHSGRSCSPPHQSRRSRSPAHHQHDSLSPIRNRRRSRSPRYFHHRSFTPLHHRRNSLSPIRYRRRSHSPPCHRSSFSPPHHRLDSLSSPRYRRRSRSRSCSPPHPSRYPLSFRQHRRISRSPIHYRRHSCSPPPPTAIRSPLSPKSRTPSRPVSRPPARSSLENSSPIDRSFRSHVPMATSPAKGSELHQISTQLAMENTDSKPHLEDQRPTKSLCTMLKPDATTNPNSETRVQDRSAQRYDPVSHSARSRTHLNSTDAKLKESISGKEIAEVEESLQIPPAQSQASASAVSAKASVDQVLAPSLGELQSNDGVDVAAPKNTGSNSETGLKGQQLVSDTGASLVHRTPSFRGPSRPSLVPFDPFGPLGTPVDHAR